MTTVTMPVMMNTNLKNKPKNLLRQASQPLSLQRKLISRRNLKLLIKLNQRKLINNLSKFKKLRKRSTPQLVSLPRHPLR